MRDICQIWTKLYYLSTKSLRMRVSSLHLTGMHTVVALLVSEELLIFFKQLASPTQSISHIAQVDLALATWVLRESKAN